MKRSYAFDEKTKLWVEIAASDEYALEIEKQKSRDQEELDRVEKLMHPGTYL